MALTAGRASSTFQTLTTSYETAYSSATHGPQGLTVFRADTDDVILKSTGTGLHERSLGGTVDEQLIPAGKSIVIDLSGGGTQPKVVQVKGASASSRVTWGPMMAPKN